MNTLAPALFEAPVAHELIQHEQACNCGDCRLNRELESEFEWGADPFETALYPGMERGHEDLTVRAIEQISAEGIPGIDAAARQALLRGVTRPDTGHVLLGIPTNPITMIGQQFVEGEQKRHALRGRFETSTQKALIEIISHLRSLHKNALAAARSGHRGAALEWIGEALHLIQDSFSDAHTQRSNMDDITGSHPIIKVRFFGRRGLGFSQAPGEHQVFSPVRPYRGQRLSDIRDKIWDPDKPNQKILTREAKVAIHASADFLKMMLNQLRRGLSPQNPIANAELDAFINWHLSSNPIRPPGSRQTPHPGPRLSPAPPSGRSLLRFGSRGPAVREAQSRLNRWLATCPQLGLPALVVDGIFGPLTRSMVRAFQSAEGLRADGIVGTLTWARLLRSGTSPAPPAPRPSPVLPGAGYPQVSRFVPARYFTRPTRQRHINRVVIHITAGGSRINGTIGWFQDPASRVSAHYIVGQDGEVVQMVRDGDIAWHAGPANSDSIGIEHVARPRGGFGRNDPGLFPTQAQYCSSARLVRWLCRTYNIPVDRVHILGHSEADARTTHRGCPNAVWDWTRYMNMVTGTTPC